MGKKLTNEKVDNRLIDRNIKSIGEYINNHTSIEWECIVCKHKWFTAPVSILTHGTGCPSCTGQAPLTNEKVDTRLIGRNIERIGECAGVSTNIEWKCVDCKHNWLATPGNVLNHGTGCPMCTRNKAFSTNHDVDARLVGRNIKRIGEYVRTSAHLKWRCTVCNCHWMAKPNDVLDHGTGCPDCASTATLSADDIDRRLIGKNIKRIGEYVDIQTHIVWECLVCKHKWIAKPDKILNAGTGCTRCVSTVSKSETVWLNFLNVPDTLNNRQVRGLIHTNKKYKVDGYIPETNTIYEFWGDYWHGNPIKYPPDTINVSAGRTFGELYQKTLKKRQMILDAGYNLVEVWESEFIKVNNKNNVAAEIHIKMKVIKS